MGNILHHLHYYILHIFAGKQVTKLVPILTPVEECVDVPREICQKAKGNPQKVVKQVTKKWCYTPTAESGLV